ncbi:23S rRNA (uracil(1939)-C(5))-methyltransferase RlmD [Eggerthellaceae bacterium zg-997]|nr:23S rRNA (uracil(1939)-C(5))-methyltransferase RlmD [Eggerthellaceae bacterium zg-997]
MEHTVTLERLSYGPDAVGHLPSGKTVFVPQGAPGDVVVVEVVDDRASYARARLVKVVEPSPDRVTPESPYDQVTGAAPWQHIAYEAQLGAKRACVVDQLTRTAHLDPARADEMVMPCLPSKRTWGYRNKIEMAAELDSQGRLVMGYRDAQDGRLAPVEQTLLAHKAVQKVPKSLRGALRFVIGQQDLGIHRVGVRHSLATGEMEVAIWTRPGGFPRALVAKTVSDACKATSIVRVLADEGPARKIKGVETLAGRGYWRERVGDFEFSTRAPSFFQVNTAQAARMVETALQMLGCVDGAVVADLYAGGGTFSIPLAAAGADVVAVEAASSSVRDLRFNADLNGVFVDVLGGDAARELEGLGDLDALVVDPPRAGLAPEVPALIAKAAPLRVVYVSCDPATWARDVARFEQQGYRLVRAQPVDVFPQTFHVETVSLLERVR